MAVTCEVRQYLNKTELLYIWSLFFLIDSKYANINLILTYTLKQKKETNYGFS